MFFLYETRWQSKLLIDNKIKEKFNNILDEKTGKNSDLVSCYTFIKEIHKIKVILLKRRALDIN